MIREARMGQLGFFDAEKRLAALSAKGDPLEAIDRLVPWERFRSDIEAVVLTPDEVKKSSAAGNPLMRSCCSACWYCRPCTIFRTSKRNTRFATGFRSRGFCGWASRTAFRTRRRCGCSARSSPRLGWLRSYSSASTSILAAQGYMARGGQMVDATIVPVPKQRNSRDENETVKAGGTPSDWEKKPAKLRQKDRDARWTKKHGKSFFGYKNHVNADAKHKLIRRYEVTDAAVHDSQPLDALLTKGNTSTDVFADSAYRSAEIEAKLKVRGFNSRIHRRASRNHPLSNAQTRANRAKSRI